MFSDVRRALRLGHDRKPQVRSGAVARNEKELPATLLLDAQSQPGLLLQRRASDQVDLEAGEERLQQRCPQLRGLALSTTRRGLMKNSDILRVWGGVLRGRRPFLSLEITKECPLKCPGCYAYTEEHLGPLTTLRQLSDFRGQELVSAAVAVVRRFRPVHISIVGGEPLVRYRELSELLPILDRMGVEVQLVTSAVRPIPVEWSSIGSLHVVVSIDGLAEEHDRRRTPATYDRILKHIVGHRIAVHCTVTRQMLSR